MYDKFIPLTKKEMDEQGIEQFTDGSKAGSGIRDKEDENDQCGNAHDGFLFFVVAFGNEFGDSDGIEVFAVTADLFSHQQEV